MIFRAVWSTEALHKSVLYRIALCRFDKLNQIRTLSTGQPITATTFMSNGFLN
jgi:hypothetical protein